MSPYGLHNRSVLFNARTTWREGDTDAERGYSIASDNDSDSDSVRIRSGYVKTLRRCRRRIDRLIEMTGKKRYDFDILVSDNSMEFQQVLWNIVNC